MENIMQKVIVKALKDPSFKERLIADPAAVLKEEGVDLPANAKINIIQAKENEVNSVIPFMPEGQDVSSLNDEDLAKMAGGTCIELTKVKYWWG